MTKLLTLKAVKALPNYRLQLLFSTGEWREFDVTPLLSLPVFKPLQDPKKFAKAKLGTITVSWNDGEIDIAPSVLYQQSTALTNY